MALAESDNLSLSPVAEIDPQAMRSQSGDDIVTEAMQRFEQVSEFESTFRQRFLNDLRFRHGDSENGYQWPNALRRQRDTDSKPCLTINNVRQHNLQIVNDQKQNKSAIKISAVGNGATKESADAVAALVRHIEYQSNAQDAYSKGMEFQVDGGYGVWRLKTGYADNDTFEQEIYILEVGDPLSVYFDPSCKKSDKSDGRWAFVFDSVPKAQFKNAYPEFAHFAGHAPLGSGTDPGGYGWYGVENHTMVCEYFRVVKKEDTLYEFTDRASGRRLTLRESRMPPRVKKVIAADPLTRKREVWDDVVEWYLIVGQRIVDSTEWLGKYIPLIPVIGEEIVIDGMLDRKGHTRAMTDAQRMYNYNASSQVEHVALQGKTPWVAPLAAIEEYTSMWNTANVVNHSVLVWKHIDDEGQEIPPPFKAQPPASAPAFQEGMDTAFNQMMMASGQWQNQLGMQGNERTGAAIGKRQQQSYTSTYHFQDNYERALRYTGQQLIDLIPKIYDTKRAFLCQAEDGTDFAIETDPAARQIYEQKLDNQGKVIQRILNPQLGRYDVQAGAGPSWATRRDQTVEALTLILTQAPALTGIVGDLLMQAMDFREADEAAQRLKRMIPPQALGQGPSQSEQQLQQQVIQLRGLLEKSLAQIAKDKLKLAGREELRDIEAYNAETQRFAALSDSLMLDQGGIKQVVEQLVHEALANHLDPVAAVRADANGNTPPPAPPPEELPPMPGARKASDGEWYITDPTRRGKYMKVAPLIQKHLARGIVSNA